MQQKTKAISSTAAPKKFFRMPGSEKPIKPEESLSSDSEKLSGYYTTSKLEKLFDTLIAELYKIKSSNEIICAADGFEKLEVEISKITSKLGDYTSAIIVQKSLESPELKESGKALLKASQVKMKDMGARVISIKMLGGTKVEIIANYYHKKSDLKNKKRKKQGIYPGLSLLGINDKCSPALSSRISIFATAASSFEEAKKLMETLYGFSVDVKTIQLICKRFAMRARLSFSKGSLPLDGEYQGKRVIISTDGGRIRVRKNKKGKKTKKNRRRYYTYWREPKLILVYVVDENGRKDREISPVMDASLDGPDAVFVMLLFYLEKLGVNKADKLLFVSDGANWIWERAKDLISNLGFDEKQCWYVLDFYHAVEHLGIIATYKRWNKKEADKWIKIQRHRLLKGNLKIFIEEIESVCKGTKSDILKRERRFFKKHLPHMRYAEIKDYKLPIGSGAVESGIRRVVNMRLKGAGIFWKEEMADAMLFLRSYYKAGRWNVLKNMAISGGMYFNEQYL